MLNAHLKVPRWLLAEHSSCQQYAVQEVASARQACEDLFFEAWLLWWLLLLVLVLEQQPRALDSPLP